MELFRIGRLTKPFQTMKSCLFDLNFKLVGNMKLYWDVFDWKHLFVLVVGRWKLDFVIKSNTYSLMEAIRVEQLGKH